MHANAYFVTKTSREHCSPETASPATCTVGRATALCRSPLLQSEQQRSPCHQKGVQRRPPMAALARKAILWTPEWCALLLILLAWKERPRRFSEGLGTRLEGRGKRGYYPNQAKVYNICTFPTGPQKGEEENAVIIIYFLDKSILQRAEQKQHHQKHLVAITGLGFFFWSWFQVLCFRQFQDQLRKGFLPAIVLPGSQVFVVGKHYSLGFFFLFPMSYAI